MHTSTHLHSTPTTEIAKLSICERYCDDGPSCVHYKNGKNMFLKKKNVLENNLKLIFWVINGQIASQNPTHWTLLYNSDNDGLSLNRFEHHVMGYRGPTVVFLRAEGNRVFCVAVDQSWKESIHFWGTSNTIVLQLSPEYRILDRKKIGCL